MAKYPEYLSLFVQFKAKGKAEEPANATDKKDQ